MTIPIQSPVSLLAALAPVGGPMPLGTQLIVAREFLRATDPAMIQSLDPFWRCIFAVQSSLRIPPSMENRAPVSDWSEYQQSLQRELATSLCASFSEALLTIAEHQYPYRRAKVENLLVVDIADILNAGLLTFQAAHTYVKTVQEDVEKESRKKSDPTELQNDRDRLLAEPVVTRNEATFAELVIAARYITDASSTEISSEERWKLLQRALAVLEPYPDGLWARHTRDEALADAKELFPDRFTLSPPLQPQPSQATNLLDSHHKKD